MTTKTPFTIQTKSLTRYLITSQALAFSFLLSALPALGILIALDEAAHPGPVIVVLLAFTMAAILFTTFIVAAWSRAYVKALGYELDGDTLRIKQGVFNWERKAIPMDRVTDIRMSQGIIMRRFGIWNIHVQTASQGGTGAEGTLHAVANPKFVRETLLAARTTASRA